MSTAIDVEKEGGEVGGGSRKLEERGGEEEGRTWKKVGKKEK